MHENPCLFGRCSHALSAILSLCRIIDNLPAASITVDDLYQTTYYSRGFLVGAKVSRLSMLKIPSTSVYVSERTIVAGPLRALRGASF